MPTYRNKTTGEIRYFHRVRSVQKPDGTFKQVIPDDSTIDMTQWEWFDDEPSTSFNTIRVAKSPTDGHGIR